MGNTDSKLNVLYRDHVFKLARPDADLTRSTTQTYSGSSSNPEDKSEVVVASNVIPLFNSDVTLEELSSIYLNAKFVEGEGDAQTQSQSNKDFDQLFSPFYLDFISAGNNLTMELFNNLISPEQMRYIYKVNPTNYTNLLRFAALKIYLISKTLDVKCIPHLETQLVQLLVCTRILTKLIPIYMEKKRNVDIFWTRNSDDIFGKLSKRENVSDNGEVQNASDDIIDDKHESKDLPPLGFLLVRSCINLLFIEGFTITSMGSPGSMTHLLWENGVNTQDTAYHNQTPRIDSNRLEIINLLLALCSSDLYKSKDIIMNNKEKEKKKENEYDSPNKFLYCLATLAPEYNLICLIASIINVTCRYCTNFHEETTTPYPHNGSKHSQQQQFPALRLSLVLSSLQLLNLMCFDCLNRTEALKFALSLKIHPMENEAEASNIALSYLSTLNREFDLKLVLSSFAKIFKLPVDLAIEQESNPLSIPSRNPSSSSSASPQPNESSTNPANSNQTIYGTPNNGNSHNNGANANNNSNNNNNGNTNTNNANNNSSGSIDNPMSLPPVSPLLIQFLIFFTKLIQNNKCFENYVADKFANRIVIFSIYYINFYNDVSDLSTTLIPLCYNLALLLSSRKLVLSKLLETFTPNYYTNKLPNFFKLSTGNISNITYRDFAIIHLCNAAMSDIRDNVQPRPWLFELIYNLLPIPSNIKDEELIQLSSKKHSKTVGNGALSYNASMTLLHLLSKSSNKIYVSTYATTHDDCSKKSYMLSPGFKLDLLALLLRAVSIYIVLYFDEAQNLAFALCRHQRVLLQARDSIESISKSLNGKGTDNGISKVQPQDYFEYCLNPRLLESDADIYIKESNKSNTGETQNVFFEKKKQNSESDVDSGNEDDDDRSYSNPNGKVSMDSSDPDNNPLELSKTRSNSNLGKNYEKCEQADFTTNLTTSDKNIFFGLRPKWPIGLTPKSISKLRAKSDLSVSWIGMDCLMLLIKAVRILLHHFPAIGTITTADYYKLVSEIAQYKEKFRTTINPLLPIYIRELKDSQPLTLDLSSTNLVYQKWLYTITWADIFNTHSGFYSASQSLSISNGPANINTSHNNNLSKEPTADLVTPTMPSLERFNSNGSTISRTNSNNSSMMGYFANQNNENAPNSPLDVVSSHSHSHHVSSPKLGGPRSNVPAGAQSFFRFSWTGFNKGEDYSPIKEEGSYDGSTRSMSSNKPAAFTLDTGLLKPNIWAGTKIKLFKVKSEEKEEFSFLDMTSSLLRRFRFGSSTSVNSLETISTNVGGNANGPGNFNNNANVNSANNLTPVSSRPWTPRESVNSNFSMFLSPKQL